MIRGFRHKGLHLLYRRGDRRKVPPELATRLQDILTVLDDARTPQDANLPGFRLHRLKGDLAGFWSITVSGNQRVIFRFADGDVHDVALIDYH